MRIPAGLGPLKAAVLPPGQEDGLPDLAKEIIDTLKFEFEVAYDEKDAVGRRYRRQDAIGTPFCITVDHQSLEDRTITVRHRDSMEQDRIAIDALSGVLGEETAMSNWLKRIEA